MRNTKIIRRDDCGGHIVLITQGEIERISKFVPAFESIDTESYINTCHAEIGKLSHKLIATEAKLGKVRERLRLALDDGPRGEGWEDEINGLLRFLNEGEMVS